MASRQRFSCISLAVGCSIVVSALANSFSEEAPYDLPSLTFFHPRDDLTAHNDFGLAMGKRFAAGARIRLEAWPALQQKLLPALKTAAGRALYEAFLSLHRDAFPLYVAELEGIAIGAKIAFETLFVAQIAQEFEMQLGKKAGIVTSSGAVDHCSDYMMCSVARCVGVHNEDNDAFSINRTFLIDAQFGGPENRFRAFVYMGELPSGAFGVNSRGLGFSLNWVGPPAPEAAGLGRGFVSRSLLDAQNMDASLLAATRRGQAGGHNIQLFDFCGRSITNVEVAQNRSVVKRIDAAPFFHANQYQTLQVAGQTFGLSSAHRLKRVAELTSPTSLKEILQILGDQGDVQYPIFHDRLSHNRGELSGWTLASVVFDLDTRSVAILQGNPARGRRRIVWDVSELVGTTGCSGEDSVVTVMTI